MRVALDSCACLLRSVASCAQLMSVTCAVAIFAHHCRCDNAVHSNVSTLSERTHAASRASVSQPALCSADTPGRSNQRPGRRARQQMQPSGGMGMGFDPFAMFGHQQMMPFGGMPMPGGGGATSYSYSSSYSSSSGPNGVVHESSNSMRRGPDGVRTSQTTGYKYQLICRAVVDTSRRPAHRQPQFCSATAARQHSTPVRACR